jgi:hypothetical protein
MNCCGYTFGINNLSYIKLGSFDINNHSRWHYNNWTLLGVRKSDAVPEHEIPERTHKCYIKLGGNESPQDCLHLKSCEPLYTCPHAPFRILRIFLMWTCTWTSFTSRNLRDWFHTFTSLPLVHTLNPNFLRWRIWLGFPRTSEALFMRITIHQESQTEAPPDSRNSRVRDLLNFARFQSSWNRQWTCKPKPIRQSFRGILEDSSLANRSQFGNHFAEY